MNATSPAMRELVAPAVLGLETRAEFRRQAIDLLEMLPEGDGQLHIELGRTTEVDSSGLGVLMLVQRRAAERRQTVVLRHPSDQLRFLLNLTKLDDLFIIDAEGRPGAPAGTRGTGMDGNPRRR